VLAESPDSSRQSRTRRVLVQGCDKPQVVAQIYLVHQLGVVVAVIGVLLLDGLILGFTFMGVGGIPLQKCSPPVKIYP
jgi:hypothetical protein